MDLNAPYPDSLAFAQAIKQARAMFGPDVKIGNQTCAEYARLRLMVDIVTSPPETERIDPELQAIGREIAVLLKRHEAARQALVLLVRDADRSIPGLDLGLLSIPVPLLFRDTIKSVGAARDRLKEVLPRVIEVEGQRGRLQEILGAWRNLSPRERASERRFQALEKSIAQLRADLAALRNSLEAVLSHGAATRKQRIAPGVKPVAAADGSFAEKRAELSASIAAARARREAR